MADTALILGLAGIGGTLLSPWLAARLTGRQHERAFQHERTMRDEEELRAVLDDVAARLEDAASAARAAQGRLLIYGRKIGQEKQGRDAVVDAGDANVQFSRAVERLAIRLGNDHPVKRAAVEAQLAIGKSVGALGSITYMGEEADLAGEGAQVTEGLEEFARARRAFVDVASAYAGSRLPRQVDLELGFAPGELARRRDAGQQPNAASD